ncbi:uncharacterized protein LOC114366320 isoform X4 [Ostrinia furnacalis]|uniref:uncharacterized protein LOC114366320 isoform X3 n=1 Tax=Ostrinia furnacalis TaxID=93504 RepID=UPI00103FD39D|nr:uncharacterized protein LOC114366320 isoform X3 [Ostrinia furnacalis]XP_028178966.1 uncharacterized protein LOC114366320 isoform X4 [Ostrinia furnacalis]
MSQKASRKSAVNEEKEKNTDTPVKEMKKKMAANAEKEKQAAEKLAEKPSEKHDKKEKAAEKPDKSDKSDKPAEKPEKSTEKVEKSAEKNDKVDKKAEKSDKKEKQPEKKADPPAEKKEEKEPKDDKGKPEKPEPKKSDAKPKQNGSSLNGSTHPDENGTVSPDDDSDELADEMFPELAYDDASDPEFEPPDATGRSYTRRSQAKSARTPETPRPASDKTTDAADDSKVLKLKEDAPTASDRKLRSSDSPKPQDKKSQDKEKPQEKEKEQAKNALETQKVQETKDGKQESVKNQEEKENGDKTEKIEVDVVIEIEGDDEPRKTDTNYSKSRVKVSPYRRSLRADHTATSMLANYTGNNTTMEMDITESSFVSHEEGSLDDSSYLSGLRSIRGRRSYKPLKEMTLRHVTANRSANKSAANVSVNEQPARPTGTVVGRKRKPEAEDSIEIASEAGELLGSAHSKRMRLLERLTHSFRRTTSTPLPARRAAEIVGINTDLPLTAPVASPATFDPEALKPAPEDHAPGPAPIAVPLPHAEPERDNKRCVVM